MTTICIATSKNKNPIHERCYKAGTHSGYSNHAFPYLRKQQTALRTLGTTLQCSIPCRDAADSGSFIQAHVTNVHK
jgi:hypothetical protein